VPATSRLLHLSGGEVPVYQRSSLGDDTIVGPCLIEEPITVSVLDAGAALEVRAGHLVIELAPDATDGTTPDATDGTTQVMEEAAC
jgi:hypothetical protein